MRFFIDTNIFMAVLRHEMPYFKECAQVLTLKMHKDLEFYTSAVTIANTFYMMEKRWGSLGAKNKLNILYKHIGIVSCGKQEVEATFSSVQVYDVEDGIQYFSALHQLCKAIITLDQEDYYYSKIPVYSPTDFLNHLSNNKY